MKGRMKPWVGVVLLFVAMLLAGCFPSPNKEARPEPGSLEVSVRSYTTGELLEEEVTAVIDGKVVTTTTGILTITEVSPGTHKLYVTAGGHLERETWVFVESGKITSVGFTLVSEGPEGVEVTLSGIREAKRIGDIDMYMEYHAKDVEYRAYGADDLPPIIFKKDQIRVLYGSDFVDPDWSYSEEDEDIFLLDKIIEHTPDKVVLFREGESSLFWVTLIPEDGLWKIILYDARAKPN